MHSWNMGGLITSTLDTAMVLSSSFMTPSDRATNADYVAASEVLGVGWTLSAAGPIPGVINETKLSRYMLQTGKEELSCKTRRSYYRSFAFDLTALILGGLSMAVDNQEGNAAAGLAVSSKLLSIVAVFDREFAAINVMRYANRAEKSIDGAP